MDEELDDEVPVACAVAPEAMVVVEPECVAVTTTVAASELAEAWLYAPDVKLQTDEMDFRAVQTSAHVQHNRVASLFRIDLPSSSLFACWQQMAHWLPRLTTSKLVFLQMQSVSVAEPDEHALDRSTSGLQMVEQIVGTSELLIPMAETPKEVRPERTAAAMAKDFIFTRFTRSCLF